MLHGNPDDPGPKYSDLHHNQTEASTWTTTSSEIGSLQPAGTARSGGPIQPEKSLFEQLDTNQDGVIDRKEFEPVPELLQTNKVRPDQQKEKLQTTRPSKSKPHRPAAGTKSNNVKPPAGGGPLATVAVKRPASNKPSSQKSARWLHLKFVQRAIAAARAEREASGN